ncbi:PHB depolymerase family esterase [Domibacillus sp. DTU_2020_1001157_1_SI_ALB_TIR_016]|uniref:prolyl oligopeptidase family serine peptidase n=1 Tax=Domibacillus sp. DTU_2020_1001157_1_SI_ALB_TIR_016 TaxID=3077789 RepID=UPI0028EC3E79|nr:PHB depolymerase family esterase [Domibacillus sp. DTU_2020_1001157_1_SI_ALB_TIR_016]WNS78877.1 PHB depolymerase family esterase [Domibacillus sp. DTU_2020_1001157_1_SI_ALB_TIR_016]
MLKKMKTQAKTAMISTLAAGALLSYSTGAAAQEVKTQPASYQTVTEIKDWGAVNTKLIVDLGRSVPKGSITPDTFSVNVKRSDHRLKTPFLEEGSRKITNVYVSDKKGNPAVKTGRYAVLEMEVSPASSLSSALNYDAAGTGFNDWTENKYTITQQKDIQTNAGVISGLVINQFAGETKELVEDFSTGQATYNHITLSYANYAPEKDKEKNPLIIWLHGGGEGGTDGTIPLSANKAVNFATEDIQDHFDGAYVLAPQAPTYWMDGITGRADGTSKYEEALMALIQEQVAANPDIDPSRIYIGGASNGGYMTMLMTRDYPGYFAASFPICEGLNDSLISDEDIQSMKQTPTWFVTAENDTILPPSLNTVPTYERFVAAGAENVHLSLFEDVHDTSGLYTNADGTPYQYNGHWSWIYVFNNEVDTVINGNTTTLMDWLADQSLQN